MGQSSSKSDMNEVIHPREKNHWKCFQQYQDRNHVSCSVRVLYHLFHRERKALAMDQVLLQETSPSPTPKPFSEVSEALLWRTWVLLSKAQKEKLSPYASSFFSYTIQCHWPFSPIPVDPIFFFPSSLSWIPSLISLHNFFQKLPAPSHVLIQITLTHNLASSGEDHLPCPSLSRPYPVEEGAFISLR